MAKFKLPIFLFVFFLLYLFFVVSRFLPFLGWLIIRNTSYIFIVAALACIILIISLSESTFR